MKSLVFSSKDVNLSFNHAFSKINTQQKRRTNASKSIRRLSDRHSDGNIGN